MQGRRNHWLMKKWMNDTMEEAQKEGLMGEQPKEPLAKFKGKFQEAVPFNRNGNGRSYTELKSSYGTNLTMKDKEAPAGEWNKPFDFASYNGIKLDLTHHEDKLPEKGILIQSTSGNSLIMDDTENKDLPPWNAETYNGPDPVEEKPIEYPKIYGWKSPSRNTYFTDATPVEDRWQKPTADDYGWIPIRPQPHYVTVNGKQIKTGHGSWKDPLTGEMHEYWVCPLTGITHYGKKDEQ